MGKNNSAIIETLLYSSLFHFPLTKDELYYFYQSDSMIDLKHFDRLLEKTPGIIDRNGYYALEGREADIVSRQKRLTLNQQKVNQARHIGQLLSFVPTILFIGISGSLAVQNATREDDIDLFIITERGSLFTSRFFALLLLEAIGRRRRRGEEHASDKICLNMWLDESALGFREERQNLYTAREIQQIVPLINRNKTYQRFLQANSWTTHFLPHAKGHTPWKELSYQFVFAKTLRFGEALMRMIQLFIIRRHLTTEEVTPSMLALHPNDQNKVVLDRFSKLLLTHKKYYTT